MTRARRPIVMVLQRSAGQSNSLIFVCHASESSLSQPSTEESLLSWARGLGRNDCASVLQENLNEGKAADEELTEIAESELNIQASVT